MIEGLRCQLSWRMQTNVFFQVMNTNLLEHFVIHPISFITFGCGLSFFIISSSDSKSVRSSSSASSRKKSTIHYIRQCALPLFTKIENSSFTSNLCGMPIIARICKSLLVKSKFMKLDNVDIRQIKILLKLSPRPHLSTF